MAKTSALPPAFFSAEQGGNFFPFAAIALFLVSSCSISPFDEPSQRNSPDLKQTRIYSIRILSSEELFLVTHKRGCQNQPLFLGVRTVRVNLRAFTSLSCHFTQLRRIGDITVSYSAKVAENTARSISVDRGCRLFHGLQINKVRYPGLTPQALRWRLLRQPRTELIIHHELFRLDRIVKRKPRQCDGPVKGEGLFVRKTVNRRRVVHYFNVSASRPVQESSARSVIRSL